MNKKICKFIVTMVSSFIGIVLIMVVTLFLHWATGLGDSPRIFYEICIIYSVILITRVSNELIKIKDILEKK